MSSRRARDSEAYELKTRYTGSNDSLPEQEQDVRIFEEESLHQGVKAHLLDPIVLAQNDNAISTRQGQWKALGAIGICILSIGTIVIIGAVSLLSYFWCLSMRARDGEIVHPWVWSQIVFSDWASRVVTITAAVLRVSLALQMAVFTAMMASLMIEIVGVPLSSVPIMSMLRALSVSPWNLITSATFEMSWLNRLMYTTAVAISITLTIAFQFASILLLSDFNIVAQSTPRAFANMSFSSNVGSEGSKLWNSQPLTYFRFAEKRERFTPSSERQSDLYEDTGPILRALLPFEKESNRSRLQKHEGPAAVIDSRVVCIRPKITGVSFSMEGQSFGGPPGFPDYEEFYARGGFGFESYGQLPLNKEKDTGERTWYFNCVVLAGASA